MENIDNLDFFENFGIEETIEIAGFKGNINSISDILKRVDSIKSNCCEGCIIQLIDARAIAGKKHILHGIIHGILAFKRNANLANDLGIEICVRTSAQRQISKALDILGLKEGKMDIIVVLINCPDYFIDELSNIFSYDDSVFNPNISVLKSIYNISSEEIAIMEIEDILIDKTSELIVSL
ncbi:MAG: KEOPS complex subunit Cgi121 [Methanobrevibacter sp.]|nr:KEOPS complex subunit Cgi121 [Methanobrevibacter sp.]